MRTSHSATVRRGQPVYGQDLGVVLLDGRVPRPVGDIGNARTFDFPVDYDVATGVKGPALHKPATAEIARLLDASIERLIGRGARAITTSCGLLANYQRALATRPSVPIATSSLVQLPLVLRLLPPEAVVGVLTIDAAAVGDDHFEQIGLAAQDRGRVRVLGVPRDSHFFTVLAKGEGDLDVARASAEIIDLARGLHSDEPNLGGFVLECTNLCVYSAEIRRATGLPVWDAVGLARWLHAAVAD